MSKKCCNHDCDQGRTCPTVTRMPTEYADYDHEFDDSLLGSFTRALAGLVAAVAVALILTGVAGYLLNR